MNEERRYVRVDAHGVMRIGNSRVMLDSIVAGFEQGHSPETLQQYPALSLEEVYGAITYYLAHTDEVHAYLNSKTSYGRHGVPRAQSGQAPSLSVCEHYGQQRLPSAHES
jgi:uncharacterized protein (DUF433 family)